MGNARPNICFLIIGQERSGTTFVQTLLNSHPDILCRGEMFDPSQIDDSGRKNRDQATVQARDANPSAFLTRMLQGEGLDTPIPPTIGIKLLTHHNSRVLSETIPAQPDLRLIHIRRANKLAQFASRQQVRKSGNWTSQKKTGPAPLIEVSPSWATSECNRLDTEDFLIDAWLAGLPNPRLTLAYTDLSNANTPERLCEHLGVAPKADMTSPLHKQGQNKVADRFTNSEAIAEHFDAIGRGDWLKAEL